MKSPETFAYTASFVIMALLWWSPRKGVHAAGLLASFLLLYVFVAASAIG